MLSSFNVLPPEMWVTARIVYFIFMVSVLAVPFFKKLCAPVFKIKNFAFQVYYQVMIKDDEMSSKIRGCVSIEAIWTALGMLKATSYLIKHKEVS